MARKSVTFVVPGTPSEDEPDAGKTFVITRIPAEQGEWWAIRALMALAQAGAEVPEAMGMAGLAQMGYKALMKLQPETIKPLLDEMLTCIQVQPDPQKPLLRALNVGGAEDIEDFRTYLMLRVEWWKLHTGFLRAAKP